MTAGRCKVIPNLYFSWTIYLTFTALLGKLIQLCKQQKLSEVIIFFDGLRFTGSTDVNALNKEYLPLHYAFTWQKYIYNDIVICRFIIQTFLDAGWGGGGGGRINSL